MRWKGHVACKEYMINSYNILVGKPEGKRPFGRSRLGMEDNIRMNLRELRWEDVDWVHFSKDTYQWRPVVNIVMNLRAP
jgi:hypothetical protein